MSKIAEAYGRSQHPKIKNIKGINFEFCHSGASYSYIKISYNVNKKIYDIQLNMDDFFNWIGEQLLKNI